MAYCSINHRGDESLRPMLGVLDRASLHLPDGSCPRKATVTKRGISSGEENDRIAKDSVLFGTQVVLSW